MATKPPRTSLKDIASDVGVSVSTVSYALNDGPKPVAAELKQRILKKAEELNYRPNRIARSMKTNQTNVVGILHPKLGPKLMTWPIFGQPMAGVVDAAQEARFDVLLYTHNQVLDSCDLLDMVMDKRADGFVLVAPDHSGELIELLVANEVPLSLVAGEPRSGLSVSLCDNAQGVSLAMNCLFEHGHVKIGHLAGRLAMYDGAMRRDCYIEAMKARGLSIEDGWITQGDFTEPGSMDAAHRLLSCRNRPSAVFCSNDESALAVMRVAFAMGLEVPRDLSIIGFDDGLEAMTSPVPLTTVRQPFYAMGFSAAKNLIDRVKGIGNESIQVFPNELVNRASVGIYTKNEG